MLHGEVVAVLGALEDRFPVAEWSVGGIHVWPIIRTHLTTALLLDERQPPPAWSVRGLAKRTIDAARAEAEDELLGEGGPALGRADVVFLSRPCNRTRLGTRYYDQFFDPLADLLEARGRRTLLFEYRARRSRYRVPRHRPSLLLRPLVVRALPGAAASVIRAAPRHLPEYGRFLRYLRDRHPHIQAPHSSWVVLRTAAIDRIAARLGVLLDRASPRLMLLNCYYSLVGMASSLAASRRGIRTVDVQHGVTLNNPNYQGWRAFPSSGYALLPERFWCWAEADTAPVRGWPATVASRHQAFVGGHPWMALFDGEREGTRDLYEEVRGLRGPALNVLVTLTWSSALSPALKRILEASPPDWTWWIRLHPLMDREREAIRSWCAAHARGRVLVDRATDLPLPLLLRETDVHLTHNSTVIQEAASAGVPSVLIDRHGLDVYTGEIESGWARFEDRTEAVFFALEAQRSARDRLPPHRPYPPWTEVGATLDGLLEGEA